jgi:signal transduction histidine kinase
MSDTRPKTILVVDDTPENLRLLSDMLTEQGYRVRLAPNGQHALTSVRKEQPDLILLDIVMPDISGYEVCQQLKADEHLRHIPVLFISALNEVFDKVTAFASGGVDFITKPFQIEEVLARIHTHLSLEDMRQMLHTQNAQLQEQNRELEAFAHTVAHDLKSPLATLFTSLKLLQEEITNVDGDAKKYLDISIHASQKMDSIIQELLLLASVRKEAVKVAPVDMGEVVQQAFNRLLPMLDQYQPEIVLPEAWPSALGYGPWIEEVWVNYLSNAMKYGGKPPRLELCAETQPDGMIRFGVLDNGAGLQPDARTKLFTEFTRLDSVRAEGHGLGLSIVRRIVEKLGGQFGVESVPAHGSMFYFALPQPES